MNQALMFALMGLIAALLSACSGVGENDAAVTEIADGKALLRINIAGAPTSPVAAKSQTGTRAKALLGVPEEITRLPLAVRDASGATIASSDLIASEGIVAMEVPAGAELLLFGEAMAGAETLFRGQISVAPLAERESRSIRLRLDEIVSLRVTPPPSTLLLDANHTLVVNLDGFRDMRLRFFVNGIEGGNASFGTIDEAGRYTPPTLVPTPATVVLRTEPRVAPSFAEEVSLTLVAPIIQNPPVVSDLSVATDRDTPVSGQLQGTDSNRDALTFRRIGAPSSGTAAVAANGAFTYTPNPGFVGIDQFTFRANDGRSVLEGDSNLGTVRITVRAVNRAPTATARSLSTAEDTALIQQLTGVDPDGDALVFSVVRQPTRGTLNLQANGMVSYVPNLNLNGGDSFSFRVSDGGLQSEPANVSINVTSVNDAPQAQAATATVVEDGTVSGALVGSDVDDNAISFVLVTPPANGSATVSTTGAFTYTPAPNFFGTDRFSFRVADGQLQSASANVELTATAVNDAPVAQDLSLSTPRGVAISGQVLAADVDADALIFTLASNPTLGNAVFGLNGNFVYTPNAGDSGDDSFTVTVRDAANASDVATINVRIVPPVNRLPQAQDGAATTERDLAFTGQLSATDPDGDVLRYVVATAPVNGSISLDASSGQFVYAPAASFTGTDTFRFRASDEQISSPDATFRITITVPVLVCTATSPPL